MTDFFALLAEARRPWLDGEALKQKFFTRSASLHPDKVRGADAAGQAEATGTFAELNAAYACLAEPKSRLLHLLELERGARPAEIQEIPGGLADLFAEVSRACRGADGFLAEKSRVTSPLLLVQWFERGQEWTDKLNALQQKLNGVHGQLLDRLKALDGEWLAGPREGRAELLAKIEELYRLFGYFNRWQRQIQERVVQLSL
jgi:curved DNA-binding protein CbpA